MSPKGTPLKKAHEEDTPLTSCARIGPSAAGQPPGTERMAVTIQRAIVLRDAGRKGEVVVINNCLCPARSDAVRLIYHFSALTGHQSLSSATAEKDFMFGTKMSGGIKDSDWFFVKKPKTGIRRTPPNIARRLDVATASRKTTLIDSYSRVALPMGLKGGCDSVKSTLKRSHDGTS